MSSPDDQTRSQHRALGLSTVAFTVCFAVWTIFSIIGVALKDQLGLSETQFGLLIGTPVLSMIGAIAAALTLGARGQSVLIALLVLPLYIPVLIFGAGAVEAALAGIDYSGHLALLGAGTLLGLVFTPFVVAAALKISLD